MDLFERVSEDIKTAMKAKDKVALETLKYQESIPGSKNGSGS